MTAAMRINLTNGTTTIDLYAGAVRLMENGLNIGNPKPDPKYVSSPVSNGDNLSSMRYGNRIITLNLKATGTTLSNLKTNIRAIERMLTDAQAFSSATEKCLLELQWGDTAGQSTYFEVVQGELKMPSSYYSVSLLNQKAIINCTLSLECKPFGAYASQDVAQATLNNGGNFVRPDSGIDPGADWTNPAQIYDSDIATAGSTSDAGTSDWVTIGPSTPTYCNCIEILACTLANRTIEVDIYYSAAWHNIYNATAPVGASPVWIYTPFAYATVSNLRIRSTLVSGSNSAIYFYDARFMLTNFLDITTSESFGDVPAKLYLKIAQSGATGTKTIWISKRSGAKQPDNLLLEAELETTFTSLFSTGGSTVTASDVADAACSGGVKQRISWYTNYQHPTAELGRLNYVLATPPRGTFRVLVRCTNNGDAPGTGGYSFNKQHYGIGYSCGGITKTPTTANGDYHTLVTRGDWETLDLGLITIPPIAESDIATNSPLELRLYWYTEDDGVGLQSTLLTDIDFIFLSPTDEGEIIVTAAAADILALDAISERSNVFTVDVSGNILAYPARLGKPFMLGRGNTRIYILRDDVCAVTFTVDAKYIPQFNKI